MARRGCREQRPAVASARSPAAHFATCTIKSDSAKFAINLLLPPPLWRETCGESSKFRAVGDPTVDFLESLTGPFVERAYNALVPRNFSVSAIAEGQTEVGSEMATCSNAPNRCHTPQTSERGAVPLDKRLQRGKTRS